MLLMLFSKVRMYKSKNCQTDRQELSSVKTVFIKKIVTNFIVIFMAGDKECVHLVLTSRKNFSFKENFFFFRTNFSFLGKICPF